MIKNYNAVVYHEKDYPLQIFIINSYRYLFPFHFIVITWNNFIRTK